MSRRGIPRMNVEAEFSAFSGPGRRLGGGDDRMNVPGSSADSQVPAGQPYPLFCDDLEEAGGEEWPESQMPESKEQEPDSQMADLCEIDEEDEAPLKIEALEEAQAQALADTQLEGNSNKTLMRTAESCRDIAQSWMVVLADQPYMSGVCEDLENFVTEATCFISGIPAEILDHPALDTTQVYMVAFGHRFKGLKDVAAPFVDHPDMPELAGLPDMTPRSASSQQARASDGPELEPPSSPSKRARRSSTKRPAGKIQAKPAGKKQAKG